MKLPEQSPPPGSHTVKYRGDVFEFRLELPRAQAGEAWLRTDLGRASARRREVIGHVENGDAILARGWHDIPMRRIGERCFALSLPLLEVGTFHAKALFVPEGETEARWPRGPDAVVKIEPASTCCANTVYAAFVRQFGGNRERCPAAAGADRAVAALEEDGYTVIPPSGTFRDLVRQLDVIVDELGFRILQLLPIHPTPTTYARMGRFGSPFAVLDFLDVDPALAEFDRRTTPLDQFRELTDAVHERGARLFIDVPINHTGWASHLQIHHPEWFARDEARRFASPGAWGVTWKDLSKLDYADPLLWRYMADVFLFWCRRGVDGFRCDAGYMVPVPVWEYICAKVRNEFPDTVFLLEGLGGRLETTDELLTVANLNWAYSELFQQSGQRETVAYLKDCLRRSAREGLMVHFAETHDNDRLASSGERHARLRTALTAMCSHAGGFGITAGVEWFAREKVDVHGAMSLSWGSSRNQVRRIARINALLEDHAAFHGDARVRVLDDCGDDVVALLREPASGATPLLVLANLDLRHARTAVWDGDDVRHPEPLHDLLSSKKVHVDETRGRPTCVLSPGQVMCLSPGPHGGEPTEPEPRASTRFRPHRGETQAALAKALAVHEVHHGQGDVSELDVARLGPVLARDPKAYCAASAGGGRPATVVTWTWPRDLDRVAMVPPGFFLLVKAPAPFVATLRAGECVLAREESLTGAGAHFALFLPLDVPPSSRRMALDVTILERGKVRHAQAPLIYLCRGEDAAVHTSVERDDIRTGDYHALATNGRGAMAQVRARWGEILSQYDALLAANPDPSLPVDRYVVLSRCRAWVVHRDYSQELNADCLDRFGVEPDETVYWEFSVPVGMGRVVGLRTRARLCPGKNAVTLEFERMSESGHDGWLDDSAPVRMVVRPDVDGRVCHATTKAYTGPEAAWPAAGTRHANGFVFRPPGGLALQMTAQPGSFTPEPEWTYMVPLPFEADRGLDGSTDVFSPGYFGIELAGGQRAVLQAEAGTGRPREPATTPPGSGPQGRTGHTLSLREAALSAMRQFIVGRADGHTVIAGYPWFLDWGRDTLICLRGMIAAGLRDEALSIIRQFAGFEVQGTLPNMIRGTDASDRDTSDAPLWLVVACADLLATEGAQDCLTEAVGDRTLTDVIRSIVTSYMRGTRNGIRMDPGSGLVFSPAHFTWMDTNHPAGTPRRGYPIEIQALWYAALGILAQIEPEGGWHQLAARVRRSIHDLYILPDEGFLADCLHGEPGTPAAEAVADDALRPNQLFAITLGAVDDPELCAAVLSACEELLVPGAIRSLADRGVTHPLPVEYEGRQLNDPLHPYWGTYRGDENTQRKPAYHNGTAWTWPFPSYCEALYLVYGEDVRETALALLASSTEVINRGCLGQVPEIVDGNAPHELRGCGAQAWGVTELYRVLALLE